MTHEDRQAQPPSAALTQAEHDVVELLAQATNRFNNEVLGNGPTREYDLAEWVAHIHALQHAVMAQAAGRAYPMLYRLQGEVLP